MLFQADKQKQEMISAKKTEINFLCSIKNFDKEVEQLEKNLTMFFNSHAKIARIIAYLKH